MHMQHLRFAKNIALLSTLLAFAPAYLAVADEDTSKLLVGNWFGERIHSGQVQGKPFNHRRWVTTHKSDGTARDIQRYYLDDQVQAEVIEDYRWGVQGSIYWNVCQSEGFAGALRPCSERSEYEIQSVTSREFRYHSKKTQVDYSMVRVPEDFRLP
jgi:hypothetical protein